MHIDEWKSLKLSDFPQYKCLCELCDCGCFQKSNKKHTPDCRRHIERIVNGLEAYNSKFTPFNDDSVYADSFKKFGFIKHLTDKSIDDENTDVLEQVAKLKFPIKRTAFKLASLELPDKEEKISTRTTNRDHFKGWTTTPAKTVREHPEIAGQLIYPNSNRRLITTNDELFHKNYGNFKAESTAINLFEKSFKLTNGKMDFKTIYRQDYPKFHGDKIVNDQNERMTKNIVERRNQRMIKIKIPMQTKTQSMIDFSYDKKEFRKAFGAAIKTKQESFKANLAEEHLRFVYPAGRLSDISEEKENEIETELRSKSQFNFGLNYRQGDKKNRVKFELIPDLHVIKKLNGSINTKKVIPPIPSNKFLSSSMDDLYTEKKSNFDFNNGSTSYREDFKNPGGFEMCRLKAFKLITSREQKNQLNKSADLSDKQTRAIVN